MLDEPHGQLILQLLRPLGLAVGDALPLNELFQYAELNGTNAEDLEAALVAASAEGWVIAVGDTLALTQAGYTLLNPANDNED